MVDIRSVTPTFAVAPQLPPEAMAEAAARGFKLVINNRPDGEEANQPSDQAIGAAAAAAGLDYLYVPVRGGPTPQQVQVVKAAIDKAEGPVLAFCRSGTRSIITWSLGQAAAGADRGSLVAMAADAGYDLSSVLA
jgi:uncharacterized protein (TIGR01244 family)